MKNKILDNLYEMREGEIENNYIAKYGEPEECKEADNIEEDFIKFIKKFIKNEKDMEDLCEKINQFELCAMMKMCFWYKPYYKQGFIDGISMNEEIKEEKLENFKKSETIIYKNIDQVLECIKEQKIINLKENKNYKKIIDGIEEIKKKFPRVESFLSDKEIVEFTNEELKAILSIIDLTRNMDMIEAVEVFKILYHTYVKQ